MQTRLTPKQMRFLMKASISSLFNIISTFKGALCSITTQHWPVDPVILGLVQAYSPAKQYIEAKIVKIFLKNATDSTF